MSEPAKYDRMLADLQRVGETLAGVAPIMQRERWAWRDRQYRRICGDPT